MKLFKGALNLQTLLKRNNSFQFIRSLSSVPNSLVSIIKDEKTRTATVSLQRPPVNSLSLELFQDIIFAVKSLEKDKFKGFILASSSPTVFCAGLDIMELYNAKEERLRSFWKLLQETWRTLYLTPLYTVAAINGHTPAAGVMFPLSCDYSVMINSKATIGLNETKLGIVAPVWLQKLLVLTMGFRKASLALSLGTLFTPEEALALNIVDELVSNSEQLMELSKKHLELGIQIPGPARAATKYKMRNPHVLELNSYADQELEEIVKFILSDGVQNSLQAYLNTLKKKQP